MKTRLVQYLGWSFAAFLLMSSTLVVTVQAQEGPSKLFLPSLSTSTADVLRDINQSKEASSKLEDGVGVLPPGLSFPPGITSYMGLPICDIPTPKEAAAFEKAQQERIAENGGSESTDMMNHIVRCRYDESQAKPMEGPLGDPLDYLAQPQNDQSDKPQGMVSGDFRVAAVHSDSYAWLQYDMYSHNHLGILADWLYAAPSKFIFYDWSNYDYFVRIAAGNNSQSAACGGLSKLLVGILTGRPGDTWSLVAYTPELIFFNQGISACTFNQSGHYAQTGEIVAFEIYRGSDSKWYTYGYIDDNWYTSGPFTPGWTSNYASRIAAGNELFAENGYSLASIHQTTKSVGSTIVVYPVGYNWHTWSDFDLPSGYTGVTTLTIGSPWAYYSNVLATYYGALRAYIP